MATKLVSLPPQLDRAIRQIIRIENTDTRYVSYSKILAYLAVLGIDRYREFNPKTQEVKNVAFDMEKFYRARKPR